jgi:hypothetical protein
MERKVEQISRAKGNGVARMGWFNSDERFNDLFSQETRALARRHWTPVAIARKAARFLATQKNARILDIGSGVGKFCLSAAHFTPSAIYHGVEQRRYLVDQAESLREELGLSNVHFIHGNFTQLKFSHYDHFYFFNSFYENLSGTDRIDDTIEYSGELFNYYNHYLYKELEQVPEGTRLVTYHSLGDEIPPCFLEVGSEADDNLKYWIKA